MTSTDTDSRDDFSPATKELLGKRAGFMCAFPECRRLTVGPSEDRVNGTTMVGVAAHITAASARGPRFDTLMSPEERSSERNGVWVCQTHGKLIDDTASVHTTEEISRWKKQHEEWVFARVSNAENHLTNGISELKLTNVGPFKDAVHVKLGRFNVVYGDNSTGKSTLCEAIAAFSGRANFNSFADRWQFCRGSTGDVAIEAVASVGDAATRVSLIQQSLNVRRTTELQQQRLRVEIDGNIAPSWPRGLFNIVRLADDVFRTREGPVGKFAHVIWSLARQLDVDPQNIWDVLDADLFATSVFGYRVKRRGVRTVEFSAPDSGEFYTSFDALGGSDQVFVVLEVLIKMLRVDRRITPWLLVLDACFFGRLDSDNKQLVFEKLATDIGFKVQTVLCVTFQTDAEALKSASNDSWFGATSVGKLTVHTFL